MNKFLKKKPVDGLSANDEALHALSQPTSPAAKKASTSRWKKNKKQPEVKPQLDLSIALPPSDDFRTSLIMPSLSTRFSMLREQDDPNSKLGKASDDSVLQPRRKSRMADFGYSPSPLFDIAEVSSLNGSIRPPPTDASRQHSFVSEEAYNSDADVQPSIMTRSRPGEGNILFGGRQKIYKIPTSGTNSTKSLGRLVYDDDVGMSAFQKYRVREREVDESQFPRPSDESQGFDFGLEQAERGSRDDSSLMGLDTLPNDSAKDLSHSPSFSSYEKKRSTTSSTARSDARSSTAATSIASQSAIASAQPSPAQAPVTASPLGAFSAAPSPLPANSSSLERSGTKTRRLYEQGLDQHMQDQQTSALSRLNSIQRQRGFSTKGQQPHLHGTRSTGNIHERSAQPVYSLRTQSPPLSSPLPQVNTSRTSSPGIGPPQSPLEPQWDENNVLKQALEPGDRGKATAMGAFNKPAQAFDEQQYLERQKALQRSNSNAALKHKLAVQPAAQQNSSCLDKEQVQMLPNLSARARSLSASRKHEPTKAYNVFQNAVNQFPHGAPPVPLAANSPLPDTHRTFFGNISASEDEDEEDESQHAQAFSQPEYGYYNNQGRWQPSQLQPVSEHPALRSQRSNASLAEVSEPNEFKKNLKHSASSQSLRKGSPTTDIRNVSLDSPTLGPQTQALNGLVHHLRQGSNHSSLYPADEFGLNDSTGTGAPNITRNTMQTDSIGLALGNTFGSHSFRDSSYAVSNPWDLDEQILVDAPAGSHTSTVSPIDEKLGMDIPSSRQSEVSFVQETLETNAGAPLVRGKSEIPLVQGPVPLWQQELRKQHIREASTATQQEREAFANELAARRAAIQESMKSIVERDTHSRGTSPAPGPLRALSALRTKPSKDSVAHAPDSAPKAPKMPASSANLAGQFEKNGYSADGSRVQGNSPRPLLPTAQHPAFKPEGPGPSTGPSRDMDPLQAELLLAASRSTPSTRGRSRSNSGAAAGRSRSRTGPYRDDLEKAMAEGRGSSGITRTPEISPLPAASLDIMSHGDHDFEGRKNLNHFDQQSTLSSSKSAVTLMSNDHTSARSDPATNTVFQNSTPPLSDSSSSLPSTYTPIVPSSARGGTGLRRKTISKHDISEPTLISSTSNVDTVDLPEGASLKNGMEEAPPIPPINPRRRATRKLFSRHRSDSSGDHEPKATASDSNLLNTSPQREYHFQPSPVVRMPTSAVNSPAVSQHGFNPTGSPERTIPNSRTGTTQRALTASMEGGMF